MFDAIKCSGIQIFQKREFIFVNQIQKPWKNSANSNREVGIYPIYLDLAISMSNRVNLQ